MKREVKTYTQFLNEGVKYGVQHEGDMWNVYTKHPKTGAPMLYKVCADRKEARLVFNNYKASLKKQKTR